MTTGNLAGLLTSAAERWGGRTALIHEGTELGYDELEQRSARAAGGLAGLGVGPGDRVGLQLRNSPAFVATYFGILRLGATVVPQNPLAKPGEVAQAMDDAGARLVVDEERAAALLDGAEPRFGMAAVAPDDTAVILYTSGTTGRPKGAELTHANLVRNAAAAEEIYGLRADDVILGALPLYHSYGQTCTLNGAFAVGARVALMERFDAVRAARTVAAHGVTVLLGVPTMFSDLAHADVDDALFASLRVSSSGGAPLPEEVREHFEARAGVPLLETYGLSETSPIATCNGLRAPRRPATVGWPIAGVELKIVDTERAAVPTGVVGEIAIRGHNIMKGYWANPDATREAIDGDGWFHSGDLGHLDESGCCTIVGRVKDLIIRGGHNVYPREIEERLHDHPDVRYAAVVGVPDARLGEEVGAAIALVDGAATTADELREWIRDRVAPQKYPRHVWLVDELPTGPTGKVLKRAITPPAAVTEGRS